MQRCAALRAGLGQHERSSRKIEGSQILTSRQLCFRRSPVQSSSNHQMQHQPEITLESKRNALTDSPQLTHNATFDARNRWLCSPKQKGARNLHSLERLPND